MANALEAFSADLSRLAELSDEEISALESSIMEAFDTADEANDEAALTELADALDQVRTEMEKRQPASEAPADEALPEPAPAVASLEANDAETPITITADAAVDTTNIEESEEPAVSVPQSRAPITTEPVGNVIVAGADLPGVSAGSVFTSMSDLTKAFAARINSMRNLIGGDGDQIIVASIQSRPDDDRILYREDPEGNLAKIEALTNISALTAAGGACAPLTTRYDLFGVVGVTDRPVRDALAGFQADRGGIRFFTSPTLASLDAAIGQWSAADDAAYDPEDDATWKVTATVACPSELTAQTGAVTLSLTFGTIASRVFPENVQVNTKLSLVQYARIAESALLAQIKAGSTAVAGVTVQFGAIRDLFHTIARIGAWYRSRNRLSLDFPLRAILPAWLIDVMRTDAVFQPPVNGIGSDFAVSAASITALFREWGINVTWALDGVSPAVNTGGDYAVISGTTLPAFPTNAEWCLFAEGSWLYLDGGTLDLGIVRDSTLVRANNYMQFSEGFESAAKIGGESLWFTSPVSAVGSYAGYYDAPVAV